VGLVGLCAKATMENRRPSAELAEYKWIRDTILAEPRPFTVAVAHLEEPSSKLAERIAKRLGVPVVTLEDARSPAPAGRWIFFEGLACHGHSLPELFERTLSAPLGEAELDRFLVAAFDPRRGFGLDLVTRPTGVRDACAGVERRAAVRRAPGPVVRVDDDPPMVIFDRAEVPLWVLAGQGR
jgi:hypothetical protein